MSYKLLDHMIDYFVGEFKGAGEIGDAKNKKALFNHIRRCLLSDPKIMSTRKYPGDPEPLSKTVKEIVKQLEKKVKSKKNKSDRK